MWENFGPNFPVCFVLSSSLFSYHAPVNAHDYLHFPTREGTINLEKLRLPAKIRAIEKFQSRVSLWTYVGDLEA